MDYTLDNNAPDSTEYPAFRRMLETAMSDQNAAGWDQPTRIYQVTGTIDDPAMELLAEEATHPIAMLDAAYHQDLSLGDKAFGMVIATESWAAVTYDVMKERAPELMEKFFEQMPDIGLSEEEIDAGARRGWSAFLEIIPFEALPENLREEVRTLVVVLRDGTVMICSHTRDSGKVTFRVTGNNKEPDFNQGYIPESMRLFINGEHPVPGSDEDDQPNVQVMPLFIPGMNNDNNPFT